MNNIPWVKKIFLFFAGCIFLVPGVCSECLGTNMELLESPIDIAVTPRNQWNPAVAYNSSDNDFMVLWRTNGKLRDDCSEADDYDCSNSFHSIDGQRISAEGEPLGDQFMISQPEIGWKTLPKIAYNPNTNDYMVFFTTGLEFIGQDGNTAIIDNQGAIISGPAQLYPTPYNLSHPEILFNSSYRQFLVAFNDNLYGNSLDNLGYILDESGNQVTGPFIIGGDTGTQFNPQAAYNSTDDTYFVIWEDFRNVGGMWDPSDIYGAVIDSQGGLVIEVPVVDDFGDADEGDQRVQNVVYNPDRNEYLTAWRDTRPSLDNAGVVGRIIQADGTPAGPDFVIADAPGSQSMPQIIYVKSKGQYFILWDDNRNASDHSSPYQSDNTDIYAKWLNYAGEQVGDEIPICTDPGVQTTADLAYSPVMDRFLIAWKDKNAPDDYAVIEGEGGGHVFTDQADVRGALYGVPSFLSCRVVDGQTGSGIEGAAALVIGPLTIAFEETIDQGWCNIVEDSQPPGTYVIIVFYSGYQIAVELIDYQGGPKQTIIALTPW